MIHIYVFFAVLALVAVAAFILGGAAERCAAILLTAATGATVILPYRTGVSFYALHAGLLTIDAALLVVLVIVELRTKRTWLSWACPTVPKSF